MHGSILKRIRPGDTIITFNYDMIVEESIAADGANWDPSDGYGLKAGGTTLDWARRWNSSTARSLQERANFSC